MRKRWVSRLTRPGYTPPFGLAWRWPESLSPQRGRVQAAADHSDHGVQGLGNGTVLVDIITHHLTSFQQASAPRPPAEGTGSQI